MLFNTELEKHSVQDAVHWRVEIVQDQRNWGMQRAAANVTHLCCPLHTFSLMTPQLLFWWLNSKVSESVRKNAKPGPLLFRLELTGLGSFRLGNRLDWSFNLTPVYLMYQSKSDCQSIVIKLMNFPTLVKTTQNSNSLNQMSWYWCKKVKSCKKKSKSCLVAIVGHPPQKMHCKTLCKWSWLTLVTS